MAQLFTMMLIVSSISTVITSPRYYFDYSDCETQCTGSYCVIYNVTPYSFQTSSTEIEDQCRESASPDAVCLHPDSPPIRGESIWPEFRDSHPTPQLLTPAKSLALDHSRPSNGTTNLITIPTHHA